MLFETGLLLLLLKMLGELKQRGLLSTVSQAEWLQNRGLPVGEQAPSFTAINDDGNTVNLNDFLGQRCILAFISPGCSACAETVEALNAALRAEQNLVVLLIGGTDHEANHAYAVEHDAQMSILTPASDATQELYRVRGVPFVFVLDKAGIICAKGVVNEGKHLQDLLTSAFTPVTTSRLWS